jgi:hypothetical protein
VSLTSTFTLERLTSSKLAACDSDILDILSHSAVNSHQAMVVIGYDLTHRQLNLTFSLDTLGSRLLPGSVRWGHGLKVWSLAKQSLPLPT